MIASRILTVLAAIALVGAFALATLIPPLMPLGQVLLQADHNALTSAQATVTAHLSAAVWMSIVAPCLERPAWMLPAMLGIVLCGLALSTRPKRATQKRRRSG